VVKAFADTLPCYIVGVPGNHDCNFKGDQSAREELLKSLSNATQPQLNGAIADIFLAPQLQFFEFLDVLIGESERTNIWANVDKRIAWSQTIEISSEILRINCFNTAWLSRKNEIQGKLFLPPEKLNSSTQNVA
jgi:hypothetical protein